MTILQPFNLFLFTFSYQQDTYILLSNKPVTFAPLPYPSSKRPPLLNHQLEAGAGLGTAKNETRGLSSSSIANLLSLYGKNTFNIPIPAFGALSREHATAPFFTVQTFCVALWCLDEHWDYSCLHCSCLSCLNVQLCGCEYERSRSYVQCQSSRIQYNAIMMENGSRFRRMNFFHEILHH